MLILSEKYAKSVAELHGWSVELAVMAVQLTKTPADERVYQERFSEYSYFGNRFKAGSVHGVLHQMVSGVECTEHYPILHQNRIWHVRKIVKDMVDRSVRMVDSYFLYLEAEGLGTKLDRVSYLELLKDYFCLAFFGQLEKFLKFHTCYLLAGIMASPPPERLRFVIDRAPGCFLDRLTNRQLRLRAVIRKARKDDFRLFFGLQENKKASLEVPKSFIDAELDQTFDDLTTDHGDRLEEEFGPIVDLESSCRRYARTLAHRLRASQTIGKRRWQVALPPTTACYEYSRREGGNLRYVLDFDRDSAEKDSECVGPRQPHLLRMVERRGLVVSIFGFSDVDSHQEVVSQLQRLSMPLLEWEEWGRTGTRVKLVGLPEPFKVRVISCGEVEPYLKARSYQRTFWSLLDQSPVFDLTSGPLKEHHLAGMVGGNPFHGLCCSILSGDYKGATNFLHPQLSEAVVEEICRVLDIDHRDQSIILSTLTRHEIRHRDRILPQRWGQLMGGPLSFVILCIVNAGVNHAFQESELGLRIPIPKDGQPPNMLINGDDISMPIPQQSYTRWLPWVSRAGLVPSVGKNFVDRIYGTINSMLFRLPVDWDLRDLGRIEIIRTRRTYFAFPPLDHIPRSDSRRDWEVNIPVRMREMLEGLEGGIREELLTLSIRLNRPFLDRYPKQISWFMPECLGGLGLPHVREGSIRTSHLRLAAYISCKHPTTYEEDHPIRCSLLPRDEVAEAMDWSLESVLDELNVPFQVREFYSAQEVLEKNNVITFSRWDFRKYWELGEERGLALETFIFHRMRIWSSRVGRLLNDATRTSLQPMNESKAAGFTKTPWSRCFV
jgi:hypothetical protein